MFPSPDIEQSITMRELIDEINNLEFINFKYRTALLSSNKDLIKNEEEIIEQGT
jgi:hypothetical protein